MMIAIMVPMNKAAMADGTLWPMAWNDGGPIFGTHFPELEDSIPRFPEDAAAKAQEKIEGFAAIEHVRMCMETRSEAVIARVQEMVRTRKDLQAAVYLVRGVENGIEETVHNILPDGSIEPPLDLKAGEALRKESGKLPVLEEPPADEPDWDPFEVDDSALCAVCGAAGQKVKELATAWRRETGHLSNPHRRIAHPLYLEIIAMGWAAVPFMLGELAGDDPDLWGPALQEITGEEIIIAREDYGKQKVVAAAWLELAKKKGWQQRKLVGAPPLKEVLPHVRHKITLTQIALFEQSLKELDAGAESEDPILDPPWRKIQRNAIESQLADLRAEVRAYEVQEQSVSPTPAPLSKEEMEEEVERTVRETVAPYLRDSWDGYTEQQKYTAKSAIRAAFRRWSRRAAEKK